MSLQQKVAAYLARNHGIQANFEAWGNVAVTETEIVRWPYIPGVAPPTVEQVMAFDLVGVEKEKLPTIQANLIRTHPEFALVYDMIQDICVTDLGMTEEAYAAKAKRVYNAWVEKRVSQQ